MVPIRVPCPSRIYLKDQLDMVAIAATLDNTLGALLIGNLISACLYGFTTLQTYTYFSGGSRGDSIWLRSLVAFLWILDTVHLVLISHAVYTYTVTDFGDLAAVSTPVWSMLAQMIVMAVSDGIIRSIFCHRIYILSNGSRVLCGVNVLFALVIFGQGISLCIKDLQLGSKPFADFSTWYYADMSSGVVADAAIAATMTWLLMRERSSMNFRRTNHVIHTLVLYSVSTGALATMCFSLILVALARMFLNSLLAALNSRQAIRAEMAGAGDMLSIPQWQGTFDTRRPSKLIPLDEKDAERILDVDSAAMSTSHSTTSISGSDTTKGHEPEELII
ncbi:hypothetical protein K466DRAFT_596979 [Polyporus arcularius HHB13444]|uniref:DUF6534 domain-containing protein n=1 Tax=Polyporus arcularius HHB13444 TaxID=1314778 RepID=A0A5C3PRB5_9APHY|nr:hypothetical protein K466DRAFT_596979 [Polyporus arcularius HHB13444]